MSDKRVNRMLVGAAISAVSTLAMTLPVWAQAPDEKDKDRQERHQKDQKGERAEQHKQAAPQERAKQNEDQNKAQQQHQADQQKAQQQRQAEQQKAQQQRQAEQQKGQQQHRAEQQKAQQQHQAEQQKAQQQRQAEQQKQQPQREPQQRAQKQEQDRSAQKQQRNQDEQRRTTANTERKGQEKQEHQVSEQRRKQIDAQQQQRLTVQRKQETVQTRVWTQRESTLHKQHRTAQYQFEQQYQERRRHQIQEWNARSYDHRNDSRFYAPANYRYAFGGRSFQTNQYGADLLRQAVNYGYQQGYPAGQADRQDGWRSGGYRGSYAYLDGDYGYNGYYLNRGEYQHYFREGFRRGYEDGYNSRTQYGNDSTILAAVLSQILNLVTN